MGNLATSAALAVPWPEVLYRGCFAAALNAFVCLVNDRFAVAIDLRGPGRDNARTRFLAEHLRTAWGTRAARALTRCAMGAAWSVGLLATAVVNIAVLAACSKSLKHRPYWDVIATGVWGVSMAAADRIASAARRSSLCSLPPASPAAEIPASRHNPLGTTKGDPDRVGQRGSA